ncbi:unnamed protein product [Diabrotica balteata]|uniref:Uncharacterized protein n=1 Tax=Diabrotica balteata TaxID=107213 RepID=A0A9N9SUM3_DIABA|nr:unnamed protein product [Diabrotica balteata]
MDKKNKKSGNKQIFIITPDELAKLGILGKISSAGVSSKPTEDTTSSPSTSKSVDKITENPDICNILRSALKKKLKPKTDKSATIHQTKKLSVKQRIGKKIKSKVLSEELETAKNATVHQTQELSVKKKIVKKIRTEVLSGELELSGQTQETHVTGPNTTIKSPKKTVSVISNTAVNLSKDTIHKIVDSVSSLNSGKNINSKLKLIPAKVGPQNFQSTIDTDFKNAIQTDDIEKTHTEAAATGNSITSIVEHPHKKNKSKKSKNESSTECESVISDSYIVEPIEQSLDSHIESNEQLFQRKVDRNQCDTLIKGSRSRNSDTDKKLIRNTVIGRYISRKPPKLLDKQLDPKQTSLLPVNTLLGSNNDVAETGLSDTDFINKEIIFEEKNLDNKTNYESPKDPSIQKEELENVLRTPVDTSLRVITNPVKVDESYKKSAKKKRGRKSKNRVVPEVQAEKNLEDSEKKETQLALITAVNSIERMQKTEDTAIASIDNSVKVLSTCIQVDETCEKPAKKKGIRMSKNLVVPEVEHEKNLEDISENKETEIVPIAVVDAIEIVQRSGDTPSTYTDNAVKVLNTCDQVDENYEKPAKKKGGRKSKNLVVLEVETEKKIRRH